MSADNLINWAMHTGIAVSVLVIFVLIIRRPFSRLFGAQAAYLLWVLPLIRLFLPEIPITISGPDWAKAMPKLPTEITVSPAYETIITGPAATPINWQLPLLIIWLGVAAFWLGRQMSRQAKTIKLMKQSSSAVPENIQDNITKAAHTLGLKTIPNVRRAERNIGPLVTGLFRPIVILPRNFEHEFSGEQQVLALTHEFAHIKRRDLWAAFVMLVFRALNWPNPLIHWAAPKFRADQEAACDAYVLKTMGGGLGVKQSYAATLIHSAKLTQTPTGKVRTPSPLCLTIHHPLKERLMTMKTSKRNSNLFTRAAAAALLVGALAVTAPLTIANAQESTATEKAMTKKVIKLVENIDGVETKKTYEIITEDGETTAYSIDEHGNKTLADAMEIEGMHGLHSMKGADGMNVFVLDGNGDAGEKRVKIVMDDHMGAISGQGHGKIMIKRMGQNADGTMVEFENDAFFMKTGEGLHASAMVSVAHSLLEEAEESSDNLSPRAQKKIKKARKALMEAQAALEAEE